MHSSVYLKHYRLAPETLGSIATSDDLPLDGTFRATDTRSGAPVSLALIPIAKIPKEEQADFERRARALTQFDHLHLARTVDFGREGDVYAFVSEHPRGETTEAWVAQYGRMPPESVLRIGLQVVSAMGAAAFDQIFHRSLNPSNLVIVPGQTAEGGWPAIKVVNLVPDGLVRGEGASAGLAQFASPEQLRDGTVDFRSEIYSLGATMAFLLTGAVYSAEPKSLQTRRFARPLRKLLQPMLRQNPEKRPQDPVAMTEALRNGLQTIEHRQLFARRFGFPFLAVRTREAPSPRIRPGRRPRTVLAHMGEAGLASAEPVEPPLEPTELPPSVFRRWSGRAAAVVAILLGAAFFAAALMPGRALALLEGRHVAKQVGVAEPAPVWEGKPLVLNKDRIPAAARSNSTANAPSSDSSAAVQPTTSSDSAAVAASNSASSASVPESRESNNAEPASPAEGPQSLWEKAGGQPLTSRIASGDAASAQPAGETPPDTKRSSYDASASDSTQSASGDAETPHSKRVTQNSDSTARLRPSNSINNRRTVKTGQAMARMASDGSVILRLPDGTIAVIPPSKVDYTPRRSRPRRRVIVDPDASAYPGPPSGYPYYSPRD